MALAPPDRVVTLDETTPEKVKVWDLRTGRRILSRGVRDATCLAVSQATAVVGTWGGALVTVALDDGALGGPATATLGEVTAIAAGGDVVVSGGDDGTIAVWRL